ncbi:MAG TPA: DUF362 domain-containing protein [Bacteroidales bacterium]|nr:DUF362 domain-containing protein [Bacteroidales bacterium]
MRLYKDFQSSSPWPPVDKKHKGYEVLVKPNIGWDTSPERAANTNPELVGRIVKAAYEAGASA